jgi:hypothetical protein
MNCPLNVVINLALETATLIRFGFTYLSVGIMAFVCALYGRKK